MEIPFDRLEPATLRALIEEFITREGTDYGFRECSLDEKRMQLMEQLNLGKIGIVFDPETQTCNLISNSPY
jgi:uncharacterized protein